MLSQKDLELLSTKYVVKPLKNKKFIKQKETINPKLLVQQ
jgi:hypothetical protein